MSNSRITAPEAPRLQGGTFQRGWPQGPRREGPQGEIKITNTLVEIPRDAASDAGSTPAASTNFSCSGSELLNRPPVSLAAPSVPAVAAPRRKAQFVPV